MRHRTLVLTMAASLTLTSILTTETRPKTTGPTEAEIVSKLPKEVQVLLAGGLCDNIHAAFMAEVERLPATSAANKLTVQQRIVYYRNWLRRKNCG